MQLVSASNRFVIVFLYLESFRVSVGVGRRRDGKDDVDVDDHVDIIVTVVARAPDCVKPNKVSRFRSLPHRTAFARSDLHFISLRSGEKR